MTASSMIGRIAAACSILDLPAAAQDQWVECAERWGVRSPPVLGCLLALAREAWACPGVYARESSKGGWVVCVRNLDPNGPVFAGPFRGPTEAEALTVALEAAP